ncbi:hypothetical protein AB1398_02905 [Hydrogenibacillus schlegelii]
MDDLRRFGSFDERIQWFLAAAVNVRTNILISGGTAIALAAGAALGLVVSFADLPVVPSFRRSFGFR